MDQEKKEREESSPTDLIGGTINIFGFKIDLGDLLASPENVKGRMEELREKLKAAGGKEVLSDEEWHQGGARITGHIRTRGILGEQDFHVGTMGKPKRREAGGPAPRVPEVMEPPVDIFDEEQQVTIVADVPGVNLEDLELKIEGNTFCISTKATAPRSYRKELTLEADVEPEGLQATCHNGVLEIHLPKRS